MRHVLPTRLKPGASPGSPPGAGSCDRRGARRHPRHAPWAAGTAAGLVLAALAVLWPTATRAQSQRFDIQSFRPSPGPRDLVIIPQTQPLSHNSGSVGAYFSFALDPLVLLNDSDDRTLSIVKNRLQLDLMAAYGIYDWVELGLVFPIILYQDSDNLAPIGTEGKVRSTTIGDLSGFIKVPLMRRLSYASGFGIALQGRINAPTGDQNAFASDGAWSGSTMLLADYRFGMGALIALQAGAYIRHEVEFQGALVGTTFVGGGAGELPLVRKWGLTSLAGVYFNVPFKNLPESVLKVPAEAMVALRWYADFGVVFTTGLNFGADCAFSVPAFRYFLAANWVPGKTREKQAILDFKTPPDDPDGDGLIGETDKCPYEKGPAANDGCPERDTDKDGIIDRLDDCPELAGRKQYNGCPRVYASENKIKVLERVHYATDQDIILPESFEVLEEVAQYIRAHKEWQEILIEGHTDSRASDAYNLDLSQRRASSVLRFLLARGVEPSRLRAQGFGRSRPLADNSTEAGMSLNRRVEFTILKTAPPSEPPSTGGKEAGPGGGQR